MVSTHVDDLFVLFNLSGRKIRDELFRQISSEVEIENLGPVSWALKTTILRDRGAGIIKILQESFINDLIQKFPVSEKTQKIPTHDELFLPQVGNEEKKVNEALKKRFQSQIGALWWLTTISRRYILCRSPLFKTSEQTKYFVGTMSQQNF